MKKKRTLCYALSVSIIFAIITTMFSPIVSAEEDKTTNITISRTVYEFEGEGSKYEIDSAQPITQSEHQPLGSVSISGNITSVEAKGKIPAYVIPDDELLSISFKYDTTLKDAGENDWHLYKDGKSEVNGIKLDGKIDNGAIILQTSFDGERWYTNSKQINLQGDITFDDNYINDVQLLNGCYYRVIVAYETQKRADSTFIIWHDNNYLKNAEVYEFYAGYQNATSEIPEGMETYSYGKTTAVVTDSGFSTPTSMDSDNPHSGWPLGKFVVGGFTNKKEEDNEIAFLKNPGDKIKLWFNLDNNVNIDKLNNNTHLSINHDTNGSDEDFNIGMQDFGRGALIVKFTNYKGEETIQVYTNFLEALASPGADTKIHVFEEGDYEVTLDYEIKNDKLVDMFYDYKILFKFKIRNSNTMVYAKDKKTGTYLGNDSVTENGFVLDWARSRYLKVNVKYSTWTKGANGYVEDIRYNKEANKNDEYTENGIYVFTVSNPTTDPYGNTPTIKRIYVGNDAVLVASMNPENSDYTINQISNMIDNEGYSVSDSGQLIPPSTTEPPKETIPDTFSESDDAETAAFSATTTSNPSTEMPNEKRNVLPYVGFGIGCIALIALGVMLGTKFRKD